MGRRVKKDVSTFSAGDWTLITDHLFVYDGWNLIEEIDASTGTVETSFVWGLDLSGTLQGAGGVGGLLSSIEHQASSIQLYCYDANGNVGQMIDASDGSVQAHYEYDPFGNEVYSYGAFVNENLFRFSTKFFDNEIELYYYGYRYYSADLGRWLTRDPVGENGGFNLYVFTGNNGINRWDYLGQKGCRFKCDINDGVKIAIDTLPTKDITESMVKGIFAAEAKRKGFMRTFAEIIGVAGSYGPGQIRKIAFDHVCNVYSKTYMSDFVKKWNKKCVECIKNPCDEPKKWKSAVKHAGTGASFTAAYLQIQINASKRRAGRSNRDAIKFGIGLYEGAKPTIYKYQKVLESKKDPDWNVHWDPVEALILLNGTEKEKDAIHYINEVYP